MRFRLAFAGVAAAALAGGVAGEWHLVPAWNVLKSLVANLFFAGVVGLVACGAGGPGWPRCESAASATWAGSATGSTCTT